MITATPTIDELVQASNVQPDLKVFLEREETGDGELFAYTFRDQVKYDNAANAWYMWRGNHWERDRIGSVRKLVIRLAAVYMRAAADALERGDKELSKAYTDRARSLFRRRRIENVLWVAQSQDGIALIGEEWDSNPMTLGVSNGVIDLGTATFRRGEPGELLRLHSPVEWVSLHEPAPNFELFLHDTFGGDCDLIDFLQRWFGYALTGRIIEHYFPIFHGSGRNGKTTLLQAIAKAVGSDYSHTTQSDMLMNVKRDGAGAQPFVHALRGRRLVWATESKEEQHINAALAKQLTGGDSITTRALFSNVVTFVPTHKVMLLTNHKPHISVEDQAMWDRVLLIPFESRFVDDPKATGEYKRNPRMLELLEGESSGILAWMVRGCLAWQAEGLRPPSKVRAATEEYHAEEDTLAEFISECLVTGKGMSARANELYKRYVAWAESNGIHKEQRLTQTALGKQLRRRFGEPGRDNRSHIYHGVGVKEVQLI